MDWPSLISELDALGMNQPQIAAACKCAQSSISALARGETKDPRHSIGEALRELLASKRSEAAEKGVSTAPPPRGAPAAGAVA